MAKAFEGTSPPPCPLLPDRTVSNSGDVARMGLGISIWLSETTRSLGRNGCLVKIVCVCVCVCVCVQRERESIGERLRGRVGKGGGGVGGREIAVE